MFTPRTTIMICLLLTLSAAGSYLSAGQESDKPEVKAKGVVKVSGPEEDFIVPFPEMEDFEEYLAMVPKPPRKGKDWAERRARHEERIGLFRLWRIMEELELSDDQVDKFFPLMRNMHKKEQEYTEEIKSRLEILRASLKDEKPYEPAIKELIEGIEKYERLRWEARRDALKEIKGIISIEQQARLLLALNEVEKDIWESIARARMAPFFKQEFKFDREELDRHLKELHRNLDSLNIRLKLKGLPGMESIEDIDINIDEKDEEQQP